MPDLWDWADVAALAIMAQHDFESVRSGWGCLGGTIPYVLAHLDWRGDEHKQIAAGIRYGAEEALRGLPVIAIAVANVQMRLTHIESMLDAIRSSSWVAPEIAARLDQTLRALIRKSMIEAGDIVRQLGAVLEQKDGPA